MGAVHTRQCGETFSGYNKLEVTVCTCGVLFAAPEHMLDTRRFDGESFYCPNGHQLSFVGDEGRLKREHQAALDRSARLAAERDQAQASARAYKGVATRTRKRAKEGVCPCCTRTFKELARHMKSQHPDFAAEV